MADSSKPKYYTVLTNDGAALEARAKAEDKAVILTHIAVGDANLIEVTEPSPDTSSLVHEVHRLQIDCKDVDDVDPNITLVHGTIPMDIGGFWIYECGLIGHLEGQTHEVLYAYANHGKYYKLKAQDGQAVVYTITIPIIQSTDCNVQILVRDYGYATLDQFDTFKLYMMSEFIRLTDRVTQHELSAEDLISNMDKILSVTARNFI